jgi:hypothetical protein
MTKYYVVVGNRNEYLDFTHRKSKESGIPLSNFVYVTSDITILGVENPTGWLYGSWRQKKHIDSIIHRLIVNNRDGKDVGPLKKILADMSKNI